MKVMARGLQERLERGAVGSRIQHLLWAFRHLYKKDYADSFLKTSVHPHRRQIVDAVASFAGVGSVLEIGCSSGPNLVCIRERIPEIRYTGIDINAVVVRKAKEYFNEKENDRFRFMVGRADDLSMIESGSIDVVLSDAVLMFVAPDDMAGAIAEMCRVARRGLVLNEYHLPGVQRGRFDGGRWVYDLVALIRKSLPDAGIETEKSTFEGGAWSQYGTLITVRI